MLLQYVQYNSVRVFVLILLLTMIETGCSRPNGQEANSLRPVCTEEEWGALKLSAPIQRIVCSGSGALRLVSYLGCSEMVVAVEQMEHESNGVAPYRLVHSEYGELPIFGEGHGRDNVEFLLNMNPRPELIIRIDNPGSGIDPQILAERSGIPVVVIPYGDLGSNRSKLNQSIRLLGYVLNRSERAESVIDFFDTEIRELNRRTEGISPENNPVVYLGGLSYRGSHGINSTSSNYPPFEWLHLNNPAALLRSDRIHRQQEMISSEQLVTWNPEWIFVDLGTVSLEQSGGVTDLVQREIYHQIRAVKSGQVFGLYPNNSYNTNFAAMMANAWFIGKTVFPDRFQDIEINKKMIDIYRFLLNDDFQDKWPDRLKSMLYQKIPLNTAKRTDEKLP